MLNDIDIITIKNYLENQDLSDEIKKVYDKLVLISKQIELNEKYTHDSREIQEELRVLDNGKEQ